MYNKTQNIIETFYWFLEDNQLSAQNHNLIGNILKNINKTRLSWMYLISIFKFWASSHFQDCNLPPISPQTSQSDNLCLVRITPRDDLFNSHLTPSNGSTLIMMVKQCLAKRKSRLIEQIKYVHSKILSFNICTLKSFLGS